MNSAEAAMQREVIVAYAGMIAHRRTGELVIRFHEGRPMKLETRTVENLVPLTDARNGVTLPSDHK